MSSPTETLAEFARALSERDPAVSWQAGLRLLEPLGIRPCESEAESAWLVVRQGQHSVRLSANGPIATEVRALVESLLSLALARASEIDEHQQTRERLEMLSQASFEGIMVNESGVVIDANQRLAEILRTDQESLLGPDTTRTYVAPEDLPGVLARLREEYEGSYVITGVRKDGTRFRAELQTKQGRLGERPVRIAAVRDVTERERTLELLRESEARLRDLVDTIFDLTVLSRDGVVLEVRGDLHDILGYAPDEVVGHSLLDFVAPSSLPLASRIVSELSPAPFNRHSSAPLESWCLSKSWASTPRWTGNRRASPVCAICARHAGARASDASWSTSSSVPSA